MEFPVPGGVMDNHCITVRAVYYNNICINLHIMWVYAKIISMSIAMSSIYHVLSMNDWECEKLMVILCKQTCFL